jgi:tetratricopeptide (TPR) repeat protein
MLERPAPKNAILEAWNAGDKDRSLELASRSADLSPVDPFYLTFKGFSSFYLAVEKPRGEERTALLDASVMALRKAVASGKRLPAKAQVSYVLGKAYYFKGEPWWDLSARYFEQAIAEGYGGADGDEYLAALYAGMGDHERAVRHFDTALAGGRSELLLLAAAGSKRIVGDLSSARLLLQEALAQGKDAAVMQKCRIMLGEMDMDAGNIAEAEKLFQAAVDADPNSAEAWYRIGLALQARNDPVRARAAWRRAVTLDPMHAASRQKLGEKL